MKVKYPRVWRHPRRSKKATYIGKYRKLNDERVFVLISCSSAGKPRGGRQIAFESHQAAVNAGWFTVDPA